MSTSLGSMGSTLSRPTPSKLSRRLSLESDSLPMDFLSCSSFPENLPFEHTNGKHLGVWHVEVL